MLQQYSINKSEYDTGYHNAEDIGEEVQPFCRAAGMHDQLKKFDESTATDTDYPGHQVGFDMVLIVDREQLCNEYCQQGKCARM